jgi:hypothetical protein
MNAFAAKLECAIARSDIDQRVIEHSPVPAIEAPPPTDLAKPMATSVPDRRKRTV